AKGADETETKRIPEWLISPDIALGLEYFFLLGHPERRWEIWGNRAPNVLAFGSLAEAQARWRHFLEDACRWEGMPFPKKSGQETAEGEQAEIGRFRFTRKG